MRNLMQGVIRGILSIRPDTLLFEPTDTERNPHRSSERNAEPAKESPEDSGVALNIICQALATPTRDLLNNMVTCIKVIDQILTSIGGITKAPDSSSNENELTQALEILLEATSAFDAADARLVDNIQLISEYSTRPEIVDIFLFVHPVRQAADKVRLLMGKVVEIQRQNKKWAVNLPSYPFIKSLNGVNAQVRHDRGGLTAAFYFRSKQQLERSMADMQSTSYVPRARSMAVDGATGAETTVMDQHEDKQTTHSRGEQFSSASFRFNVWRFLHRLQDFESRFAFKVALTTTLISIPAWLQQSRGWWNAYESWWAVVTVWVMMHPRVGGTFQDLVVRSFYAAFGALWAGLAYAAGNGNPYIMAVFAALYMIPMLHRFTQSSHPRSGVMGCLSFTVISLGAYTNQANPAIATFAWMRGLAFVIGVVAAIVVNWLLWPFIARHELRKSLSTMLLHSAILYRGVIAKYIYYTDPNSAPTAADIARSEMLEGRLREGFVRIRQLLELTRHEIRLRAPFDPLPYSALIDACERLFEHLVEVRQSSLYFQPLMHETQDKEAMHALFEVRRDAVAVILLNLYTLACALRSGRPVPRYLPSAAAARRRLLDRMDEVERERSNRRERKEKEREATREVDRERNEQKKGKGEVDKARNEEQTSGGVEDGSENGKKKGKGRRWADVYQFAFSEALTEIVEELQNLQQYTKEIVGESGWEGGELKAL